MSYTVGVKRRFIPWYRKYSVTSHDWQNGRFILNLEDGCQLHIPGFSTPDIKVYADFWTHLAQLKKSKPVVKPEPVAQVRDDEPIQPVERPRTRDDEVRQRAAERVRSIFADDSGAPAVGARSQPESQLS